MKKFDVKQLNFAKLGGIIPVVVQDVETKAVLMLGFMNEEALSKTIESKKVTFWSRTKKRLWEKGEISGNTLKLISISVDCDNDALLILAKVEEESDEVLQAAKKETRKRLIEESSDLLYHLFVLLAQKNITLSNIIQELQRRKK